VLCYWLAGIMTGFAGAGSAPGTGCDKSRQTQNRRVARTDFGGVPAAAG
jgi:hypothetical protein